MQLTRDLFAIAKFLFLHFTCVSYAEARLSYRLSVRLSVRHTLVLYQNGLTYCHAFFTTR